MVSTWDDVKEVIAGPHGLLSAKDVRTKLVIECSSISLEGSAELREVLRARGIELLAAPVSGNAKVIKAGRLSFVCSGPSAAFDQALPYLRMIAPAASYVGEGELARIVKICHNVFLGVVTQSLAEITVLAQKAGVPRHAFLDFMNQSVMGSTFTRYKTPAFVNLDFKVTFTPELLRKDLDLGLDAGRRFDVPLPLASLTRDIVQSLIGHGTSDEDFAKLIVHAREGGRHRARTRERRGRRRTVRRRWQMKWKTMIGAALALCATLAFGQGYPTKPVKVIVPFTPGSATDILARTIGQKLSEQWGQTCDRRQSRGRRRHDRRGCRRQVAGRRLHADGSFVRRTP